MSLSLCTVFIPLLCLYSCSAACEVIPKITSQSKLWWKNSHAFKVTEDMSTETEPKPFQMKPPALAPSCWCRGWCSHRKWSVTIHAIRIFELCYWLTCSGGEFFTTGYCCCLGQQQCYVDMYILDICIHSITDTVLRICKIHIKWEGAGRDRNWEWLEGEMETEKLRKYGMSTLYDHISWHETRCNAHFAVLTPCSTPGAISRCVQPVGGR